MQFYQGDIIKISGFSNRFLIVSKNAYINFAGLFHVCPISEKYAEDPIHIKIKGESGFRGVAACNDIKLIDPDARACVKTDSISYDQIMNISDAIQGIFEYD